MSFIPKQIDRPIVSPGNPAAKTDIFDGIEQITFYGGDPFAEGGVDMNKSHRFIKNEQGRFEQQLTDEQKAKQDKLNENLTAGIGWFIPNTPLVADGIGQQWKVPNPESPKFDITEKDGFRVYTTVDKVTTNIIDQ